MLHNNYTQQEYKSYHVILPEDPQAHTGELILGDLNAATDRTLLQGHNVKTIITAAAGLEHLDIPAEQTHVVFPLQDLKNQNIDAYFELSYQTISENLKRGSVLVHCGAGISRSATLVIAYYMKKYDSIFANALKIVKKIRPSVCPNLGFELQLKKYQQKLQLDHISQQGSIVKPISHNQKEKDENSHNQFVEAKKMTVTFNAPTKDSKIFHMAVTNPRNFSGRTPLVGKKSPSIVSNIKKSNLEVGGLFVEGRSAAGQIKSESFYDPQKYWHKGSFGHRKKESNSFKI